MYHNMEKHYDDNTLMNINENNNQNSTTFSTLLFFTLSFALRSNWNSVVFFFPNSSGVLMNLSPVIFNHFNAAGKFVMIHSTSSSLLPRSILHMHHRLGIVYFCEDPDKDFLNKASQLNLFDEYRSWLIFEPQELKNKNKFKKIINGLGLELATEMMQVSVKRKVISKNTLTMNKQNSSSNILTNKFTKNHQINIDVYHKPVKGLLEGDPSIVNYVTQVYKAKKTENETIKIDLGFWDIPNGFNKLSQQISSEKKFNLGGYKIQVGIITSTADSWATENSFVFDTELDEEMHFLELLDCLMYGLNASYELNRFQKLGWRNEEGVWTHLLGGVVEGTVEIGLEAINVKLDKLGDISFTHAILSTMSNVYFRQPDNGGMRDIFLEPFGPKLLLCVFSTTVLLGLTMIIINSDIIYVQRKIRKSKKLQIFNKSEIKRDTTFRLKDIKKWKISEGALWSISVLCMQGSHWSPKSISGSLLLINSLLFALVIYNSFAAFITSVLSVEDVKIKNLEDVIENDFAFGYIFGNTDELFLRTVNDTRLRKLYFKGFKENDGVSDAAIGMQKAAKEKYAFFVSARTARRILKSVIPQEKRCQLQELHIPLTKTYASIPLTKMASFKKLLNAKIIRLLEVGLLKRFQKLIHLSMPRCLEQKNFNSAAITDVYSAFFILFIGWIVSLIILFIEIVWYDKKKKKVI